MGYYNNGHNINIYAYKRGHMKLDLHVHSTASDGQYTPLELVEKANKLGLEYLAITDHDTVNGIKDAKEIADKYDVNFIPGIEISTMDTEEIHIVGLGIDENNKRLRSSCEEFAKSRNSRGEEIRKYLYELGINVDLEKVRKIAKGANLSRPHFATYLVSEGIVKNNQMAFDLYLDTPEFHRLTDRKLISPADAIELIHQANGKAILAHPGLLHMKFDEQENLISKLKVKGLDGLEVYYSRYSKEKTEVYRYLAQKYNLLISCASDYHGEKIKPDINLGMEVTRKEDLERLVIYNK